MRFLIDENVPLLVAKVLRDFDYDCLVVAETAHQSVDADLMARARAEKRVLVTFDADFSRMIFHELKPAPPGVIYMRRRPGQAVLVSEMFLSLFVEGTLNPMSRFIILELGGIVRSMPLERTPNG